MFDKALRVPKESFLAPVARTTRFIPPWCLTVAAFAFGLAAALSAYLGAYPPGLALWLLNRLLDGLDGSAARFQHRDSDLGGYLDILLDMTIYALLPIAFVVTDPSDTAYLALALLLASYYLNSGSWLYLAAILEKRGRGAARQGERTSVTMPSGLVEGAETVVFYALLFLFPQARLSLFVGFALLVLVTALQRLVWAARTLGRVG